jgi:hypothetical protein
MKAKLTEPFKGSYVPDEAILEMMIKYKQIFSFLHAMHADIMKLSIPEFQRKHDELKRSIPWREAKEVLMRTFNYEKSTVATGDSIRRCIRIYDDYLKNGGIKK